MGQKARDVVRILTGGFALTFAGISVVLCIIILKTLLTPWWIPVACVLPVSLLLYYPLRGLNEWITDSSKKWLNILNHLFLTWPTLLIAVLVTNMLTAEGESKEVAARVDRVYKETRYRTRRVGRRTYTRGAPYQVTRMDVTLTDGREYGFDIPKKLYSRITVGDTVVIPTSTGAFHLTWMDESKAKLREKE